MDTTFTPAHRGGTGTPLVCLHGFTDTWRSWELVLPALERRHDVLAPTLAGHAGGPPLPAGPLDAGLADAVEAAMDDAGFETAHIVGNSLGGYLAFLLAARGRARSVVALAPAGGWAAGDETVAATLAHFTTMQELVRLAAPRAEQIVSTPDGRRRACTYTAVNWEHIPTELLAHQMRGVAACTAVAPLVAYAAEAGWHIDGERVRCPVRIVWGTADKLLAWPRAAARFRQDWVPQADWVVLDDVGHCPQLDVPLETAELIAGFTTP